MTPETGSDRADAAALAAVIEGAWELLEWTVDRDDGRPSFQPMGRGARGLLIYVRDGHMSACIRRQEPMPEPAIGLDGKVSAYGDYFSYAGRFRIEGNAVVHLVDLATLPGMIGSEQKRQVSFSARRMILTARDALHGRTDTIAWRRAAPPEQ